MSALALALGTAALGAPAASHDGGTGTIVEIDKADELKPAALQVAAGTTITWVNKDDGTHRVRAAAGTFDSGSLAKDATFSFRFDAGGTYLYSVGTLSNSSWSWWAGGTVTVSGGSATPAPTTPPAVPPSTGATVSISDNFFTPSSLTVAAGTTVVWTNRGGAKHTVTAAGVFDSGVLSPGATFSFTFATPGTYRYVCEIHGGMTGTIVVSGDGQIAAQPTPVPATPTPVPTALPQPSGAMVHILDNSFSPATLTVPVGTTVTWMHMGTVKHTVTSAGLFDSGILSPGATFRYTFTSPGTYSYRCELHSGMGGTIIVTGSGPTLAPTPLPTLAPAPAAPAGAIAIAINDNSFNPASATVPVGTTVVWTNRGAVLHTVSGPGFSSGSIAAGATFSFTFNAPGTYAYQCDFHAEMTGTIVVTGTASGPLATPAGGPSGTPSPGPHPALPAGGLSIVIGDNVFNPGTTRVAAGTTVTWVNHGRVRHTVTSATTVFDSGVMSPDGVFSVRFDTPGTYPYVCDIHPGMKGVIEVYGSDGVAPRATPLPSAAATATAIPSNAHVLINDNLFDPKETRVTAGSEVTWMNHGVAKHTVTFVDGSGTSPLLATGESWSHTFDKPGVYRYICALHPEMTGTIVVTEAVATTTNGTSTASTRNTTQSAARGPESGTGVGLEGGILIGLLLGIMGAIGVGGPVVLALRRSP